MKHENCCPEFNLEPWDEKEIVWENKLFVKDRVRSLFHIPLNFGPVMQRVVDKIDAAGVEFDDLVVLADEDSLWGTNVFVAVPQEIENCEMITISGTFLTKVFEGPYRNVGKWMKEMQEFVESRDEKISMQYFYYTTCPKCAKKYGKNYVVLVSKIG